MELARVLHVLRQCGIDVRIQTCLTSAEHCTEISAP